MKDVKQVIVQVAAPRGSFPGAVTYGYYTVEDVIVTMTDKDGVPAGLEIGKTLSHRLKSGEDPRAWAAKMTRDLREEFRGGECVFGFDGPLQYRKDGSII